MEKLKVTIARELCQLHGVEIYPVPYLWTNKIAVKQNDIIRMGEGFYISETVIVDGKKQIGYLEKIDQLYLFYARRIRRQQKRANFNPKAA